MNSNNFFYINGIVSEKIRQSNRNDLLIILTGAFLPESFKNSDADFNIGLAIGNVKHLRVIQVINTSFVYISGGLSVFKSGVFVALNGSVSFQNTDQIFCTK